MTDIKHTTLKGELLYLIGRATAPISSAELYEKCELADEVTKVAKALAHLQSDGKVVRAEGEGRARYKLAPGVVAPAPAGKTGRSKAVQAADAAGAGLLTVGYGIPPADIPTIGDAAAPARKKPGPKPKTAPADHVADAGKVIESSAEDLADAILEESRKTLQPRWTIDQAGAVRIFNESGFGVLLHPIQARLMAEVVMATHAVLDELV